MKQVARLDRTKDPTTIKFVLLRLVVVQRIATL